MVLDSMTNGFNIGQTSRCTKTSTKPLESVTSQTTEATGLESQQITRLILYFPLQSQLAKAKELTPNSTLKSVALTVGTTLLAP